MQKKIIIIAVILFVAGFLASCGSSKGGNKNFRMQVSKPHYRGAGRYY